MTGATGIPNLRTANALSVTDSGVTVGFLIKSESAFFSFDRDGVLIGEFKTQREAMRALPKMELAS
jgi:hypothetical protein